MPKSRERRNQGGRPQEKSEYDQKVLDVCRTARVVSGGRRFSFRVVVIVGNRKGKVGLGVGKGPDVSIAAEKATTRARKAIIIVPLTRRRSIPHEVSAKYASARVILKPAAEGRGMVAGGPIRVISDLAGIRNLTGKIVGRTPNKLNNAQATLAALRTLRPIRIHESPAVPQEVPMEKEIEGETATEGVPESAPE